MGWTCRWCMSLLQEKPHKCSLCSKSFPTPGDLKSHMYVHNGSWPFKCHICNRGFSKHTNLKNHLFLHTGKQTVLTYPLTYFDDCETYKNGSRNSLLIGQQSSWEWNVDRDLHACAVRILWCNEKWSADTQSGLEELLKYHSSFFAFLSSFIICVLHQIIRGWSNQGRWDGLGI
jgi:hypothetical protein